MTRADTIARHLNAAGEHLKTAACPGNPQVYATSGPALSIDAAMGCINAAFLECLGGAAVAGEAAGPWVVRIDVEGTKRWHVTFGPATPDLARAQRWDVWGAADWAARQWGTDYAATVLPLAEAERMEAAAKPTPEPPKPAGWVVRLSSERATPYYGRHGFMPTAREAGPFASRADAILTRSVRLSETAQAEANILPVDAAGNVIEALPGVAWEAARAGEEAERLRTELAAVKAERDDVRAERDKWAANAGTLNASLRQVHTECDQLRAELDATLAERDALAAEVQRAREQKPVHLALVDKQGAVVDGYLIKTRALAEDDARRRACTVAPLYLAPVVRDHSGVIAQCEAYMAGDYELGEPRPGPHDVIAAALAALRGAS